MGKSQRDKGKRGERAWAKFLRSLGFTLAHRGVQYQGGKDSPDVVAAELPHILFEVKHTEAAVIGSKFIDKAWAKLREEAGDKYTPAFAFHRDFEPWRLLMQDTDGAMVILYRLDDMRWRLMEANNRKAKEVGPKE